MPSTPPDLRALKDEALAATARGSARRAMELYTEIARLEPDDGRWPLKVGECARALDDTAAAVAAFVRAAEVFQRAGHQLKAVAAARVAVQLAPDDPAARKLFTALEPQRAASRPSLRAARSGGAAARSSLRPQGSGGAADDDGMPEISLEDGPAAASGEEDEAPEVVLDEGEAPGRVTLERIGLADMLHTRSDSGAPHGSVDLEIDGIPPAQDTGYEDLLAGLDDDGELFATPLEPIAPPPRAKPPGYESPPVEWSPSPSLVPELPAFALPGAAREGEISSSLANSSTPASGAHRVSEARRRRADDDVPTPTAVAASGVLPPERLRGIPLLGPLSPEALETVVARAEYLRASPGDRVVAEGGVADKVYFVVAGDLVATRGDPPRPLARLSEGAYFGEMALLDDTPRSATVTAVTDAELIALPRRAVLELCERYPPVLSQMMQSLRARLIAALTATSPLLAVIPPGDRNGLVERFRLREIEPGTVLIRESAPADGLYLVLTGRAEVAVQGYPVATLTTGGVAGEMSLLADGPAEATVTAATRVTTLVLPAAELKQIIMVHPQILEHLAALSDARRAQLETARASGSLGLRSIRRV